MGFFTKTKISLRAHRDQKRATASRAGVKRSARSARSRPTLFRVARAGGWKKSHRKRYGGY